MKHAATQITQLVVAIICFVALIVVLAQFQLISGKLVSDNLQETAEDSETSAALFSLHSLRGRGRKSTGITLSSTNLMAAEKIGAGILFVCSGHALLMKRRSRHNDQKWGLPGGNLEPGDRGDLYAAATREATEELGHLPSSFHVIGSFLTRRGKRLQKHYTVFLARVDEDVRQQYKPHLNLAEHSEYRWMPLSGLAHLTLRASQAQHSSQQQQQQPRTTSNSMQETGRVDGMMQVEVVTDKDPVLEGGLQGTQMLAARDGSSRDSLEGVELHPVVEALLRDSSQHLVALLRKDIPVKD